MNIDFNRVLRLGVSLSTEKDRNKLLDLIITEAMAITGADTGILYIIDELGENLCFKIIRNHTLGIFRGGSGEEIELSPIPLKSKNICSHCAVMRKTINIDDVYGNDEFDFSAPKSYDDLTDYRTKSMLVVPFVNNVGDVIGVLQLINALDKNGNAVPFDSDIETIITAIASQAAIAITNTIYLNDIKDLFQSFVQVMITAIDEMSPYNVNHTRKIVEYTEHFIDYLNGLYEQNKFPEFFDNERREQLIMSAWLHDIGKLVTPLEVMNKSTRLADKLDYILMRFDMAISLLKVSELEGKCSREEYLSTSKKFYELKDFVKYINIATLITDNDLENIEKLFELKYRTLDGREQYILDENDRECLSVRRGNLTEGERQVMQGHVYFTAKLLSKINFGKSMSEVPKIASMHHEFLDGSGYPFGRRGEELTTEVRILSILDVFEALTSSDRPYKKTMSDENAFIILREMVSAGQLDGNLVELFASSLAE